MWERTLKDLIRGMRANKKDEAKFISQAIDEIRDEVKSKDMELKAAAVLKLTYLEMMGYDMGWASFHVLEVMSSTRMHHKAVGYLAASQSFTPATDVIMLTTNLLKKDVTATPVEIAVTLTGVSQFLTSELALDLGHDVNVLLTHSRAAVRKRAVLLFYNVIRAQPDSLSAALPKLRDKLDDPDPGVIGATVSVLCELARQPSIVPQLLPLAPQLFHILTTSTNNWMLIKVIKLFGAIAPHEPRLAKKLQSPMNDLINTTPAISLLYECVRTCIVGRIFGGALAQTCVRKLGGFLEDNDQNLRYIALLGLVKIVPSHPELVAQHTTTILQSVDDRDISIRMRALDLVTAMVNEDNIQSIVQHLLSQLAPASVAPTATASETLQNTLATGASISTPPPGASRAYRLTLSQKILSILSFDSYSRVPDMQWAVSVLVDLAYVARAPVGAQVRDALVDVCLRLPNIRTYAASLMAKVLADASAFLGDGENGDSCSEILWAAAWIAGEYAEMRASASYRMLEPIMHQPTLDLVPASTQAVFLSAIPKLLGRWMTSLSEEWNDEAYLELTRRIVSDAITCTEAFVTSDDCEVQERAANILNLLSFIRADLAMHQPVAIPEPRPAQTQITFDPDAHAFARDEDAQDEDDEQLQHNLNFPKSLLLLQPLFSAPLGRTAATPIPVPDGLDLDVWFVQPPKRAETEVSQKPKGKRGKEKAGVADGDVTKKKRKKRKENVGAEGDIVAPSTVATPPVETQEDGAEIERRKVERMERLRDDPFYLFDKKAGSSSTASASQPARIADDVDSIPIVKLDLSTLASSLPSRTPTPALSLRASSPAPGQLSNIPVTQEPEEDVPSSAPDPIKVVRVKKKKTGSSKKKTTLSAPQPDD